jgi:multisubunit Na+/H+ antiporter MnhB subunit
LFYLYVTTTTTTIIIFYIILKREPFLPKNLVRRHILIGDGKTTERKTAKPVFLQFLLVSTLSVWSLSFLGWHIAEHIADGPEESPMHESVEIENKALVLNKKSSVL